MISSSETQEGMDLLNEIKSQYEKQVKSLTNLKKQITKSVRLDQQGKSKLRIQIESLLIDLNEEIFAISEELANALQSSSYKEARDGLLLKAREYEQKKIVLLTKIKNNVSNNPLIHAARNDQVIQRAVSPGATMQ